jgi:hypothetical protein
MDITKRNLSNSKKTIPMVLPLNQVSITNIDAFHFTVGSILGDGSIHKDRHTLDIEQRSARFAMWKRGIAIDTGLIADHNVKGNYKKRLKLAEGQIVIHLPLTWKGRVKNNATFNNVALDLVVSLYIEEVGHLQRVLYIMIHNGEVSFINKRLINMCVLVECSFVKVYLQILKIIYGVI